MPRGVGNIVLEANLKVLQQKETEYNAKIKSQALDIEDRVIRSPINGVVDRVFDSCPS